MPWDGESTGELEVRGPWVATAYYEDPRTARTSSTTAGCGPATSRAIDPDGYIQITDRSKDVIKSGGEWISLGGPGERADGATPRCSRPAVIAMPDERWSERPLACVVLAEGDDGQRGASCATYLAERVAKWWLPDEFAFIDEVPKTSVGKFDKKVLRAQLADDELPNRVVVEVASGARS